jgi:hypothetical protein
LVKGQNSLTLPVDLQFKRVDLSVASDDRFGALHVPLQQNVHRVGELLGHNPGHLEKQIAQFGKFAGERAIFHQMEESGQKESGGSVRHPDSTKNRAGCAGDRLWEKNEPLPGARATLHRR